MFETISEGFVYTCVAGSATAVAAGPRIVMLPTGEILCTFMAQSKLGINDFIPLLARSVDGGQSWSAAQPIFPELTRSHSLFGAISRGLAGELFFFGISTPIDEPGESFWSDATQGMKQNELFWSRSVDAGITWTAPAAIPMDGSGSAEAPCPLTVTSSGRWIATYSPYNTFNPDTQVDRPRVVIAISDDQGASWRHRNALRFPFETSGGAEAWVVELADKRLLATAWHVDHAGKADHPNAYALSTDGGDSWTVTQSTGILGQSTALMPLADGSALFIHNQRKHGTPGVWIAHVEPTPDNFGVLSHQCVWQAPQITQHGTSAGHSEWTDFAFGEPSTVLLADGTILLVLWCIEPTGVAGIRYAKLRWMK